MILRERNMGVTWYVAREIGNEYTITTNINRAMNVTEAEGRAFNKKHNTCWEIAKSAIHT